jgi:hypothetical protein
MTKQKIGTCIFLLMFVFSFGILAAQEEIPGENEDGNEPSIESDWSVFAVPSYERGDRMFGMGLGLLFPVAFTDEDNKSIKNNVGLGGTGLLSFDYFFTSNMAAGLEVNFSFSSTVSENMLYLVPIGLRFTYQLVFHPIEIPITLAVGMAPHVYMDENILGFYLKPSLGVFYRFNSDWSFGLQGTWWWLPETPKESSELVNGNFATLTIAARYHF